jgi:hypothetical protein
MSMFSLPLLLPPPKKRGALPLSSSSTLFSLAASSATNLSPLSLTSSASCRA